MTDRSSRAGGPAAIGGFSFQHSLAAWAAVHILAERAVSLRWELPPQVFFTMLRCETEQPIDDLLIGTSDDGFVFVQVKRSLSLTAREDSDLASTLDQCVRQFNAHRQPTGSRPWERPLDIQRDRMVIATSPDAPNWVRTDLPNALLARVVHHLIEFLAGYVDVDPEQVFVRIGQIVIAAEKGEYQHESLAVDLIVDLVQRYLAEYRDVLRKSSECQEILVKVLDVFVIWPAASRLSYRLGDIFR